MIDDILKLKAQNLNIAIKQAEVVTPANKAWVTAKIEVNKLSNDFGEVIRKRAVESPESIREEKKDKYKALIVQLPRINNHEVYIHSTEKDGAVIMARYVLFQNKGNRAYIRSLYKE